MPAITLTTSQISEMLGISRQAVEKRRDDEGWAGTLLPAAKKGAAAMAWDVKSMPKPTQQALARALVRSHVDLGEAVPAKGSLKGLTQAQQRVAMARLGILREVAALEVLVGTNGAIQQFIDAARAGELPERLKGLVERANDRPRPGKCGISKVPIFLWRKAYAQGGLEALAPKHPKKDFSIPPWFPAFLEIWQRPMKPSLAQAYHEFCARYEGDKVPTYAQVRYKVDRLDPQSREYGRRTGNAMLAMKGFKRRSTTHMLPGDCYTADGTTFDAEVQDPHTGRPMKPEITIVVDVATRRLVGMSMGISESYLTILDALRIACVGFGIPAMFYTDNGSSYHSYAMTDVGVGLMARLGIGHTTSIPCRPQGKGLIERHVKSIVEPVSKRFKTCMHRDMDKDAAKQVFHISRQAIKRAGRDPNMPTLADLRQALLERWQAYNASPHRGLPTVVDQQTGNRRHMSPDEAWQAALDGGNWEPVLVPEEQRDELFMPGGLRKVSRCEVQFLGAKYYAAELEEFHGQYVEYRCDVWDDSYLHIYHEDGRKICTAQRDGNVIPYFAQDVISRNRLRRAKGQLSRLDAKLQGIAPGASIHLPDGGLEVANSLQPRDVTPPELPAEDATPVDLEAVQKAQDAARNALDIAPEAEPRPIFATESDRYTWLMQHRDRWTDADGPWLEKYAKGGHYELMAERYQFLGIAWTTDTATTEER